MTRFGKIGQVQSCRLQDAAKLAVNREAHEQILDNENRARSEIEEIKRQLNREVLTAKKSAGAGRCVPKAVWLFFNISLLR